MDTLYMRERRKRLLSWLGVSVLILTFLMLLVPILWLGRYARGAADDYCYGIRTHMALQNNGDLFQAIWRTVAGYYWSWQGSFAAICLMSLTPCVFLEQAYWLTPLVMTISLSLGTIKLSDTLARRLTGGNWRDTIFLSMPILICNIQFVPSPLNSFYWWNGAVYYTFFYGISLLYLEHFVRLVLASGDQSKRGTLIPGLLLGIVVGGGNYVSALLSALVGGCLWLWAIKIKRQQLLAFLLLCGEVLPFLINAAAPGNRLRQATVSAMPPVEAIFTSIYQAARDLLAWPNGVTLLLFLAWVPLLWRLCGNTAYSFRCPALFVGLTFLLFAAQNTPHFYAVSSAGPLRLRNIVFFSSFWFYMLNEWYFLGWLRRILKFRRPDLVQRLKPAKSRFLGVILCLLVCCTVYYFPDSFTAGCLRELSNGSAAAYAAQRDSRLPALKDPAVSNPTFSPLQSKPALLYQEDITPDPDHWKNNVMALYWGKCSVALETTEGDS